MTEGLHTLQEFMMHTKGIIYLLAVGYLVGFICFWRFLFKGRKTDEDES